MQFSHLIRHVIFVQCLRPSLDIRRLMTWDSFKLYEIPPLGATGATDYFQKMVCGSAESGCRVGFATKACYAGYAFVYRKKP